MNAVKLDGRKFASDLLLNLKNKFNKIKVKPRVVTILVGNDKASKLYTNLKVKAAEKIGIRLEVFEFDENISVENLKREIIRLNNYKNVKGIMIQMPLPTDLKINTDNLINIISEEKDIDGMTEASMFVPATVLAIEKMIKFAVNKNYLNKKSTIAVVGSNGFIGRNIYKILKSKYNFKLIKLDIENKNNLKEKLKTADCIVSATGVSDLIKTDFIKKGSVLIDVGAPKPEFEEKCYEKARAYSPVPGGVGPFSIACLMQNIEGLSK